MTITAIRIEALVGQTRAAAFDGDGRPAGLFLDRWTDGSARWGATTTGRIRKIAKDQGGAFADLSSGEGAFLPSKYIGSLTEGATVTVRITAERRRGKLCRIEPSTNGDASAPLDRWIAALPGDAVQSETSARPNEAVAAAFEEGLSPAAVLPGGGRLQIAETPALTAIDIDTAGRSERGRAAERANAVNLDAAEEAARQLALRGIGGLVVLDCVGPVARPHGPGVKAAFLEAFRAIDGRKAEALAPSPFGLLEAALAWRWRPVSDAVLGENGEPTPDTLLLETLRDLEAAATAERTARFTLSMPRAWRFDALDKAAGVRDAFAGRYGARIEFVDAAEDPPHLARHDDR